jgi:hypothetical protein
MLVGIKKNNRNPGGKKLTSAPVSLEREREQVEERERTSGGVVRHYGVGHS